MAIHTLSQHFMSFFLRLNPGPSFEAIASSQYQTIKGLIEDPRGPAALLAPVCFLQGSYRQQTATYTINDVDIVALARLWQPGSGRGERSFGDVIAAILALFSLLLLPSVAGIAASWIFNLWGSADILNAFYQANHAGLLAGQLGAAFFLPTLVVPLLLITHGLAFRILLQHQPAPAMQESRHSA
jgi:hypothetical protein